MSDLENKYPKSLFFIITNEFCERFCYYGMRTILVIYLTYMLNYPDTDAKIIYHTFSMLVYFFPIFGAIISDSYLGKFNTIFYISIIYAGGTILLSVTSVPTLSIPNREFTILALLLIAVGTGGIKPCVAAFGGDQFVLPQQKKQLTNFFSFFYFAINAGSLLSTFITPVLRNDVHCFGKECFPLAFAVPGILMVIAIVIFVAGRPLYKIKKPEGNVVVQVTKCITYAIRQKCSSKEKKKHWLDHAEKKYGSTLVNDIKVTLHVLVLFVPLPVFWALFDQQGSGWTFQAIRMDGYIGFYTILPDQMQIANPLLILVFIPLFTYCLYPLFEKFNLLKTPLQKMVCGGFLAALAFAISACISLALEREEPVLPSRGTVQLRLYNPTPCIFELVSEQMPLNISLPPMDYYENTSIPLDKDTERFEFEITSPNCAKGGSDSWTNWKKIIDVEEKKAYGLYMYDKFASQFVDHLTKSKTGYPIVRTLIFHKNSTVFYKRRGESIFVDGDRYDEAITFSEPGRWYIILNGQDTHRYVDFRLGGTYAVLINDNRTEIESRTLVLVQPNSIHMLWLLPQYIIITAGEIMVSITGLEFSYSQAPESMKSLVQACFLLTSAFGNLLIVIIESAKIFEKQSYNFFLYSGLMVIDMTIFTFMAMSYEYVNKEGEHSGDVTS